MYALRPSVVFACWMKTSDLDLVIYSFNYANVKHNSFKTAYLSVFRIPDGPIVLVHNKSSKNLHTFVVTFFFSSKNPSAAIPTTCRCAMLLLWSRPSVGGRLGDHSLT